MRKRFILLFLLSLFLIGFLVQTAFATEQVSFTETKQKAQAGDVVAQLNLGNMYVTGEGVAQDYKKAAKWFKKSAKQGNTSAQNNIGFMYLEGKAVSQNYKKALKWYKLSATQGDVNAQFKLGNVYDFGKAVPQDFKEALRWYVLADRKSVV